MDEHHATLIQRFRTALDLWAAGVALRRQAIRQDRSDATEYDVDEARGRWLRDRPGAAAGDRVEVMQPGAPS